MFRKLRFQQYRMMSSGFGDNISNASSFISWNPQVPVKMHLNLEKAPDNYPPILVSTMFRNVVEKYPGHLAILADREGSQWKLQWTYSRYYEEVTKVAKGFIAVGLKQYHAVGIMASNSPAWFASSLASILAGGLSCGIHMTNSPDAVTYVVSHAPTDVVVMENDQTFKQVLGNRKFEEAFPNVSKIILAEGSPDPRFTSKIISWKELISIGEQQTDVELDDRIRAQVVNEACMLIYTSGTTGSPKGALLSHDNVTWTSRISMEHFKWREGSEVVLSYLPMSHAAAHLIDCYMLMYRAGTICIADKNALKGTLVDNLRAARPTKFLGVPRVWEKIQEKMEEVGRQSGPVKKMISSWAKSNSSNHHKRVREGIIKPTDGSLQFKLARKLIFSRIHEALGLDRTSEMPVSNSTTAAPLSPSTFNYFESLDLPIYELFGCTEASGPLTTNMDGPNLRPGTMGRSFIGVHNKIYNPDSTGSGEIISKSRNIFMGYLRDEIRTKETFTDDGWLRTGDLGKFDQDGFLVVTGRLKELIITAGGKNIAPVPIEDQVKMALRNVVSNVVLIGDHRKFLTCLLTLKVTVDPETLQPNNILTKEVVDWCQTIVPGENILSVEDFVEGPSSNKLKEEIERKINEVNSKAKSKSDRIQKFLILPREFSIQGGELGPSLKLKRHAVMEMYAADIDALYNE